MVGAKSDLSKISLKCFISLSSSLMHSKHNTTASIEPYNLTKAESMLVKILKAGSSKWVINYHYKQILLLKQGLNLTLI